MTHNQQSVIDTATSNETAAIQRSSPASKNGRNGKGSGGSKVWKGIVRGLLVVLLFADAVVVGLLVNYYILSR